MTAIGTGFGGTTALGGTDEAGAGFTLAQVQTIWAPGAVGPAQFTQLDMRDLTRHPGALAELVVKLRDAGAVNQDGIIPTTTSGNLVYVLPTTGDGAKALGAVLASALVNRPPNQINGHALQQFLRSYPEVGAAYDQARSVIGQRDAVSVITLLGTMGLQLGPQALRAPSRTSASGSGRNEASSALSRQPISLTQGSDGVFRRPGEAVSPGPTQSGGTLATRPNSGGNQTLTNQTTGTQPTNSGQRLLPPAGGTGQRPVGPLPSWNGGGPAGASGTTPIPAGRPSGTAPAVLTLETPQGEAFRVTVVKDKTTNTFSVEVPQFRGGTGDITISSVRMKDGSTPPTFTAANQRVSEMFRAGELAYPRGSAGGRTGGSGTSTGTSTGAPNGTGFNPIPPFGATSFGTTTGGSGNFGGGSFGTGGVRIGDTPSFNPPAPNSAATTTFKLDAPDPMTLFSESGTAVGQTNSSIRVNGLGFAGDLAQFSAALPVLNGKKSAEFASQSDATSAALAYNRQSPVTVAVPLRLAFTDAQGRTMERSVVYEGVSPGKVGELIDMLEKTKSYQVLNRNSALAEAGLSPQGLAARENAGRQGTGQQTQAAPAEPLTAPQAPSTDVPKTALALGDTLDRLGIDRADLARAREQGRALTPDQAKALHAAATAYADAHNADPLALRTGPTPDILAAKAALEGYAEAKGTQRQADLGEMLEALGAGNGIGALSAQGPQNATPRWAVRDVPGSSIEGNVRDFLTMVEANTETDGFVTAQSTSPKAANRIWNASDIAQSLKDDLALAGRPDGLNVIAATHPNGSGVMGVASYHFTRDGALEVDYLLARQSRLGVGETLLKELYARSKTGVMVLSSVPEARDFYKRMGGKESPRGVFTWTSPPRDVTKDAGAAQKPTGGSGPALQQANASTQAGDAVPPSADLAKLQAEVTSAFPPGDIRFEQDGRLSRNGAVVLTLDPNGSIVVRHNGDIDPNLVESLKVIAEMGGKDYAAQGLRMTGTPKEITQRLSEWFREVALLQNSGNEAAALIVEGPGGARLLPALGLSPRAVVNPEEILRVVDVPEFGSAKKLHVWHTHPTGAIEHMPSGVNVHGLISQAALSAGDLNWAEDMLHILSGRWVPAQGSDLAGKVSGLESVSIASYDPLTDTITEQPIEFQPTGSAEWRDANVYPGTPGNKVADVVTLSTQAMRVTPSEGVIPMPPGTLASMFEQVNTYREPNPDGSTQPSLREVLQQIATAAAFGNPLPPLGGPDGAVLTLSQLGAKFRTAAWYVWPGLDRIPNRDQTLVYLKVPQMTVSAQTATGEVTIPAAFPVNTPTDDQKRILAAGTGDTPAQAQAYWEVLRELITPRRSSDATQLSSQTPGPGSPNGENINTTMLDATQTVTELNAAFPGMQVRVNRDPNLDGTGTALVNLDPGGTLSVSHGDAGVPASTVEVLRLIGETDGKDWFQKLFGLTGDLGTMRLEAGGMLRNISLLQSSDSRAELAVAAFEGAKGGEMVQALAIGTNDAVQPRSLFLAFDETRVSEVKAFEFWHTHGLPAAFPAATGAGNSPADVKFPSEFAQDYGMPTGNLPALFPDLKSVAVTSIAALDGMAHTTGVARQPDGTFAPSQNVVESVTGLPVHAQFRNNSPLRPTLAPVQPPPRDIPEADAQTLKAGPGEDGQGKGYWDAVRRRLGITGP